VITASWQITIARSPEEVFDFVADLNNEPKFNPDASNVVRTSPAEIGLGMTYTEDIRRVGAYTTTIDEYERPSKLGFDARNRRCDALVRFRFEPADEDATNVSCLVELTFKGLQKLFEPLLRGMIRKQIEANRGPMLKAALETGA
jgi:hypothetical protein